MMMKREILLILRQRLVKKRLEKILVYLIVVICFFCLRLRVIIRFDRRLLWRWSPLVDHYDFDF